MNIELTEENITKILMYNDGFTTTACIVNRFGQKYVTYKILFGKLLKCPGKTFSIGKMEECTELKDIRMFINCCRHGLSLPTKEGGEYTDYRSDLLKYCQKVSKPFFRDRLRNYKVIGNVVEMTFESNSRKSLWRSEVVFKKDHMVCSSSFNDSISSDFGNRVLEVAGIK